MATTTHCHCNVCGYDWEPRTERPKQCPRCKRYDWQNWRQSEQERQGAAS